MLHPDGFAVLPMDEPSDAEKLDHALHCIVNALLEISDHLRESVGWLKEIDKSIGYIELVCD